MPFFADRWALKWDYWMFGGMCSVCGSLAARPATIRVTRGPSPELSRVGVVGGPGVHSRVGMEAGRGPPALGVQSGCPCPCRVQRVPRPGLTARCGLTFRGRGAGCLRARGVPVPRVDGHLETVWLDGLVHVAVAFRGRTWSGAVVRVPSGWREPRPDSTTGVPWRFRGRATGAACPWSAGSPCGWFKIEGLD